MSRTLYLSDGSNLGRGAMFERLQQPSQERIYFILSYSDTAGIAQAYSDWLTEEYGALHFQQFLFRMRDFLARNPYAEFYAE